MPAILATQEAEIRGLRFEVTWANSSARPYLEKTFTKNGWWSGSRCRPSVQTPVLQKKKNKSVTFIFCSFKKTILSYLYFLPLKWTTFRAFDDS
jgi:hypothetical protein